jgi:hypothetical protein
MGHRSWPPSVVLRFTFSFDDKAVMVAFRMIWIISLHWRRFFGDESLWISIWLALPEDRACFGRKNSRSRWTLTGRPRFDHYRLPRLSHGFTTYCRLKHLQIHLSCLPWIPSPCNLGFNAPPASPLTKPKMNSIFDLLWFQKSQCRPGEYWLLCVVIRYTIKMGSIYKFRGSL